MSGCDMPLAECQPQKVPAPCSSTKDDIKHRTLLRVPGRLLFQNL